VIFPGTPVSSTYKTDPHKKTTKKQQQQKKQQKKTNKKREFCFNRIEMMID
jgi:hypothetical protein